MKTAHILLVEDNEGDIVLTKEALEEKKIISKVSVVKNGKEALDFVFQKGDYESAEVPDLILLDINLPLKNGHEVLEIIKFDDRTKKIPVVMLTTSSSRDDIDRAYKLNANCYITKPVEIDDFMKAITSIENFWVQLVKLPNIK